MIEFLGLFQREHCWVKKYFQGIKERNVFILLNLVQCFRTGLNLVSHENNNFC